MTARQPGPWDLPAAGAHIHLVGVAGAGMRGLGLLLDAAGYRISGCDRSGIEDLVELSARGARLVSGHDPAHVENADLVIHTSAVPAEHPELLAAAGLGVPTMKRSRALAALLNEHRLAAVAGTHGKTSITALAGLACAAAGLDPIVAVGGRVALWRGFARAGAGGMGCCTARTTRPPAGSGSCSGDSATVSPYMPTTGSKSWRRRGAGSSAGSSLPAAR
ncbi:MAG: Mur ligase domain-containing protein [Gemmatimonadales bacterium]